MGRFKFKHRITSKPAKEGIKYFVLCCSLLKAPLAFTFHDNKLEKSNGLSQTASMVVDMINQMVELNGMDMTTITLFMDNYFNSHDLFKFLLAKGIKVVGTFKTNMVPKEVRDKATVFLKENKKRKNVEGVIYCPTLVLVCEGIYYLYIVDNGPFCLATNCLEYVNKGTI